MTREIESWRINCLGIILSKDLGYFGRLPMAPKRQLARLIWLLVKLTLAVPLVALTVVELGKSGSTMRGPAKIWSNEVGTLWVAGSRGCYFATFLKNPDSAPERTCDVIRDGDTVTYVMKAPDLAAHPRSAFSFAISLGPTPATVSVYQSAMLKRNVFCSRVWFLFVIAGLFSIPLGMHCCHRLRRIQRRRLCRCVLCGYLQRGNTSSICPECGAAANTPA